MTNQPDRYYRSAGAVPFTGILLMMATGLVGAVVCGFLYAAADWYIAFDIVPFLCAPLSGAAIGAAVKWGAMAGSARHRGFLALVGFVMGAAGAYFSWVLFLKLVPMIGIWIWDPLHLANAINIVSEVGIWENQPVGVWLKVMYVVEALSMMVGSAIVASLDTRPYCDSCNGWTKQRPETAVLKLTDPERLRERLEESHYEALDELYDPAVDRSNCFHARIFACPNCEESNYLTISHVTVVQKKGETQQSEQKFINYLWVPPEVVAQVQRLEHDLQQAGETNVGAAFGGSAKSASDETA